jgi:DNA/RNA endonuclease G (NUC1)
MPQVGDESLRAHLVSVDAVEAQTGLDFFSVLEDAAEGRLESGCAGRV